MTFGLPKSHEALYQPHPVEHSHKSWYQQQLAEGSPSIQNVGQLEYHRIIPQGIRISYESRNQYECRSCYKLFSRPSALNIHIRSHTGEKPFHCPDIRCGRAFSVWSNLKRHAIHCPMAPKLQHHKSKPHHSFFEGICRNPGSLYCQHLKSKFGQPCHAQYSRLHDLKRHEQTHTIQAASTGDVRNVRNVQKIPLRWMSFQDI
jgi:uncharacterized Zn-finger protein